MMDGAPLMPKLSADSWVMMWTLLVHVSYIVVCVVYMGFSAQSTLLTLYVQLTHTVMVPTLDKEVGRSYLMMWGVLGQSPPSFSAAIGVTFSAVVTLRMLELCAQEVSHL